MNSEMNSSVTKLEEVGAVLERGGTYFGQVKQACDVMSEESNDSVNEDHNYTRSESEKKDISFNLEMKHSVALCDEVNKVIKREETVPDWELELSDSNDSKENVPKLVVNVGTNPQSEVQDKRDVNSNNKPKSQFKLRNILPIPPNILIEKLPSHPVQNDAQSTSVPPNKFPSSDSNKIHGDNPVPMVPPCSLKQNNVSQVMKAEPVGSGYRISQSHPKKEQWVVKDPSLAKSDPQALSGGHGFGSDQHDPFGHGDAEGVPTKKLRQSISIQNAKMVHSTFQNSPHQMMRPGAAQLRPALLRQVSPAVLRQVSPVLMRQVVPAALRQVVPAAMRQVSPAAMGQVSPAAMRQVRPASIRQVRPAQPRQQHGMVPIPGLGMATPHPKIRHTRSLPLSRFPPPRNTHVPPSRSFSSRQQMQLTQLPVQVPHAPAMSSIMRAPISLHQYQYSTAATSYRMIPPNRFVGPPGHPQVRNLPDYPQARDIPPSISITRVRCPSMPEVPLGTLASALAGLGKLEGDKVMVQYRLTMGQIEALKTLGIKKEDGHEVLNVE